MPTLYLPGDCRTTLASWAESAYPHESCGLLIGERAAADHVVRRVTQARNLNLERARDRYELDPQHLLDADNAARAQGLEVLGVWHTHPDHPARPSETDRLAAWPEWSYVILEVTDGGVRDLRSWRLNKAQVFDEEVIQS
ncbi:M67 family metallopeptidase [Noviherbaspirillum massiliense]|uniref:M67 family metallopeptidase n=1 Tax=Noviherbaspirillum massiliense TaxID=1465823 RepID=UPI00031FF36C|nr:M67 family metallopeptidase [Noviherbaspirillum massiliense]